MAVQIHPPSAVATYIKKRTLLYNLCQELFLQFLSVRAAPWKDYNTLGAIYLFLLIGEQVGPWLEEQGLCRGQCLCSLGRLTHLSAAGVCFMCFSPTAPLPCSTRTSPHVLEPAHHSAACKQGGGVWQQIKVNTNYGKNVAVHSYKWRINGKMHTKSKLFPQGTLGGNRTTHFKGKVPWIQDVTTLALSCLLVLTNLVLEIGISLSVLEILLIVKAGTCVQGRDQESYCSHHLY